MLAVVGDLLEDVVVRLAGPPRSGTDTPALIERRRGGSGANVAAGAAGAGAAVRFIGCVGTDALGDRLIAELVSIGVDACVQRHGRTGSVVVLVEPDGERTMLPDRAASVQLTIVDGRWLDGVTWLHVPSYSLLAEPIGSTVTAMVAEARRAGAGISVDVSSVAVVEAHGANRYANLLVALHPDVVLANADEAVLLPPGGPWTEIVKDGPRPVRLTSAGSTSYVEVPALGAVPDTTGAGDAFAAGYLAARIAGVDDPTAVAAGITLAGELLGSRRHDHGDDGWREQR